MRSEDKCPIMGIDLMPGSAAGTRGYFAVTLLDCNEGIVLKKDNVPFKKLLRLIWEYLPKILALDNIMELGIDKDELIKVLSILPPETEVVQVTRLPNNVYVNLRELATSMGIDLPQRKLDPSETSKLLALLAAKGIGSKLKTFEEKTRIIVTKARTPRAGGSSMNRFKRAVKNAVAETIAEIKEALERAGLDYDLSIDKSNGGIQRGIFTVYAPRHKLRGIVKPLTSPAVKVIIRPVVARKINFVDETPQENKYLIIGYDPGIESGLAVLDLYGNILLLTSSKDLDRGDIISLLGKLGTPLIVASDTNPPPHNVKKLAALTNSILYTPKSSLSIKEKELIAKNVERKYGVKIADSHQRDALAAAFKAYQSIKDKIIQVDKYLEKIDLEIDRERVKAEVLRGRALADVIEEEIDKILPEILNSSQSTFVPSRSIHSETSSSECTKFKELESRKLQLENAILRMRIEELLKELELKDIEIKTLKSEAKAMYEAQLEHLKSQVMLLKKKLEDTKHEIDDLNKRISQLETTLIEVFRNQFIPALKIDKIQYTTSVNDLKEIGIDKVTVLSVEYIEDINEEVIEYLIENEIIIIAKKWNDVVEHKMKKYMYPILSVNAVYQGSIVDLYDASVLNQWEEAKEALRQELEDVITEEYLEKMLLSYRVERWGSS